MLVYAKASETDCAADSHKSVNAYLIKCQIERRACGRIYDLHVDCSGGRIVLQGRCHTYHAKQLAHEAALDLAESSARVDNRIVVG